MECKEGQHHASTTPWTDRTSWLKLGPPAAGAQDAAAVAISLKISQSNQFSAC